MLFARSRSTSRNSTPRCAASSQYEVHCSTEFAAAASAAAGGSFSSLGAFMSDLVSGMGQKKPSAISTTIATIGTQQAAIRSQLFQPPLPASSVSCRIADSSSS
jgi:hypothetical protein